MTAAGRSSSSEPPIEATGLTKAYRGRPAVDGIDLLVRPGEIYGFLGPNGAGKTTTMRMLLGLVRPDSGTGQSVPAVGGTLIYAMSIQGVAAISAIRGVHPYVLTNQLTAWHDLFQTPTGGDVAG
jgi:ABC-type branched-subunit amino acid transport system ATPase component